MARSRIYRMLCATLIVAGSLAAPAAAAGGVEAREYGGNPACEDINPRWSTLYKADFDEGAQASGAHGPITWTVSNSDHGEVVEWRSSAPLVAVLVKGGPGGFAYEYAADGATADSGLHALIRPSGRYANVSHITFCGGDRPPEPEPATVTITKMTEPPGDSVAFSFTSSLPGFPLDLGHGQSATVEVDPGDYAVTEQPLDGWELIDLACSGDDAASTDMSSGTASLSLDAGEVVSCTFTNAPLGEPEPATLTIAKVTEPAEDEASFRFFGPDGWRPVLGHGDQASIEVAPGTYTLREKFEHAWELTSIECDGGNHVVDLAEGTVSVSVGEGEQVTCTYTNTRICEKHGWIAVEKYTDPVDETVAFAFESDAVSRDDIPFLPVLHHGESDNVMVLPGTYSVTELPVDGWTLASIVCDDPDAVLDPGTGTATVTISSGEVATCTYTNTRIPEPEPGTLVVSKIADPPDTGETWMFTSDIPGFEPILGNGESASVAVDAGTYTVAEDLDEHWELTDISCTDPAAVTDLTTGEATVSVPAGETVTCTYTNTQIPEPEPGTIIVEKVTVPAGADQAFWFSVMIGDGSWFDGELRDGESATVEVVTPDPIFDTNVFSISEHWVEGWEVSDISCTDPEAELVGDSEVTVPVDPGETVTCTFTNTQIPEPEPGTIIVEKITEPAGADQAFEFSILIGDGGGWDFVLHDGESHTQEVVTPDPTFDTNWFYIGEQWVEGWEVTDITCDDPEAEYILGLSGEAAVPVDPGETVTCTFTNTQLPEPPLGAIGDFVWDDLDRDGVQDAGEPGIAGVRVNLYAAPGWEFGAGASLGGDGAGAPPTAGDLVTTQAVTESLELIATMQTDANGNYQFTGLPEGYYVVEFTGIPSGYRFTTPFAAARTIDSDAATTDGRSPVMTLPAGFIDITCDAGLYALQPPEGEVLPYTGANLQLPLAAGSLFLIAGLLLLAAARPRSRPR